MHATQLQLLQQHWQLPIRLCTDRLRPLRLRLRLRVLQLRPPAAL